MDNASKETTAPVARQPLRPLLERKHRTDPRVHVQRPTCFDCVHADVDYGHHGTWYEPPEEPMAECRIAEEVEVDIEQVYDRFPEPEGVLPQKCGKFEAITLSGRCAGCGTPAPEGQPQWSWHLWWVALEPMWVCSMVCWAVMALTDRVEPIMDREPERPIPAVLVKLAEKIVRAAEDDRPPKAKCPVCLQSVPDTDGFGVLAHLKRDGGCGYCQHPSRSEGVCDVCGDER